MRGTDLASRRPRGQARGPHRSFGTKELWTCRSSGLGGVGDALLGEAGGRGALELRCFGGIFAAFRRRTGECRAFELLGGNLRLAGGAGGIGRRGGCRSGRHRSHRSRRGCRGGGGGGGGGGGRLAA